MDSINYTFIENMLRNEENEKTIKLLDYKINKKAAGDGNNVSSEVSRINVTYEIDGKVIKKSFFMKIPSNSPLYFLLKQFGIYEKECNMYTTVLPAMYKFLSKEDYFSPRCYVTSDLKIVILEDLKELGFKMVNRRNQLDFDHASAALRTLAKFHALSVKVDELNPEKIDLVKKDGFYANDSEDNPVTVQSYIRFLNACTSIQEDQAVYEKLVAFKDQILTTVKNAVRPRSNMLNVLGHGDFWSNNILFKYENNEIKIKLVDFQMSRWCSPAVDIMFMMISSVRFEVFEHKCDELLNIYHETLNNWFKQLDCKKTYTLDELKQDFFNCYGYGLNVLASVLPLVLKKATDLNLDEIQKNKKINSKELDKMFEEEKYIASVTKWIRYYTKNNLL